MENTISITNDDRIAMAEVDYIIHHMNELYLNKIPQKVRDCIALIKKDNIKIYVDPKVPLEKQGLKEYTLHFLIILNLKYWCDDQRRRDILAKLEENQRKYDEKINNIFSQAESMQTVSEEISENSDNKPKQIKVVNTEINETENIKKNINDSNNEAKENSIIEKPKENFFIRIISKIKSIIKKDKDI